MYERRRRTAKFRSLVIATLIAPLASVLVVSQPAVAAARVDQSLTAADRQFLEDFLTDNGVTKKEQKGLFAKFESGQPWDSSIPGNSPMEVTTEVRDGMKMTIERFLDGSVIVSGVSVPSPTLGEPGDIQPMEVRNCSINNQYYAVYYTNCEAWFSNGFLGMGFYFDWRWVQTLAPSITNYWGTHHYTIGSSLSDHQLFRINDWQVRYSATDSFLWEGFPLSRTRWVQANVIEAGAFTTLG